MHAIQPAAPVMLDSPDSLPEVAVLLCSYNGGQFLAQQLDSIAQQKGVALSVHVSDDGSQDQTQSILKAFRERWGHTRLSVVRGPEHGHVDNFFSLIFSNIEGDYFAYSDQDDIWDPDKLSRAVKALSSLPADRPRALLLSIPPDRQVRRSYWPFAPILEAARFRQCIDSEYRGWKHDGNEP